MGRAPCCSKVGLHRGPWTSREDSLLINYIHSHGEGNWKSLPKKAGLLRCGKSCRLRWMNYLRPDIKRGNIGPEEEDLIARLHRLLGNRWSLIAGRLPGRTDNEIKNYWNTHLSKKLKKQASNLKGPPQRSKLKKQAMEAAETTLYAPKPTRLAPRAVAEDGEGGSDYRREAESRSDVVFSWCEAVEVAAAGYLDVNQLDLGFDQSQLERVYHEYSMLLQSEMDMNQFAESLMV